MPLEPTMIQLSEAEDDEIDPTTSPDSPAYKTHRHLTPRERLQVAVWIVEGFTYDRIRQMMADAGIPSISNGALSKYKANPALIEEAKAYLRSEIIGFDVADKNVRVRSLIKHARRLEEMIGEEGMWAIEQKVIGWGKQSEHIETKKFDAALSKEYRETLRQIRDEIDPILPAAPVSTTTTVNIFSALPEDDQRQLLAAMKMSIPQLQILPPASQPTATDTIVDAEAVEMDA